jgi:hypothetical protein
MKPILFCMAIFLSPAIFAQKSYLVTGKVIVKSSQMPIQAASVFAQNTTLGTITDKDGNFRLELPAGGYDLVVTYTGYSPESRRVSTGDSSDKNMIIGLKIVDQSLDTVSIATSGAMKDGWERYGLFFSDNFIGKTPFGDNTHILNKDVLKFYFNKRLNRLKVKASTPIEIENDALGYKIKYTIDSFTYNYTTQITLATGYPLFEEMQPVSDSQRVAWNNNRIKAYKGSMLHFMKSVYNKNLREQGFEIQYIIKTANGTDTAFALKNFYSALNYTKYDSTGIVEIKPNQPEVAVLFSAAPDSAYLAENEGVPAKYELSFFSIAPGASLDIEPNGYYYDQTDITINDGYWIWQKLGDMLPYDYTPF